MKYITYDPDDGPISVVLFPRYIDHGDMARRIGLQLDTVSEPGNILGAGFVSMDEANGLYCHGRSQSLNRVSQERDTNIIRNLLK